MFKLNEKEYDETKLSDKGKALYQKLIKIGADKFDLDILANHYTALLQVELPKEEKENGTGQ
jgi:hypothetical protein